MKCPKCGGKSEVANVIPGKIQIHRYRRCLRCGKRFRTEERIAWELSATGSNMLAGDKVSM